MPRRRLLFLALFALFITAPLGLIAYKLLVLDYRMADLIPATSYHVDTVMTVDGHGDDIEMRTYLPRSDARQHITEEEQASGNFTLDIRSDSLNRVATWRDAAVEGRHSVRYSYAVQGQRVQYRIPPKLPIPASYPAALTPYLQAEEGVPLNNPLMDAALHTILPQRNVPILEALTRIHRYLQDQLKNKNFSGYTDAVTAYKLGEASCNGKGRLFVTLARKMNLPARLVGGLILQSGSKRVSHQWVEVYVNGYWVPFDTINDHFAELPANFLTLYYGDESLFRHSSDVNFQYYFHTSKRLVPKRSMQEHIGGSPLNIANLYLIFESIGISQNLLKIILMIPLGALVTVIFRNVIGIETFGTFLPALIAAAARDTGLLWGAIGFIVVIVLTSLIRRALDWMQLLHSPKMAILLTSVVIILLVTTVVSVHAGLTELAHLSLFPIAILAITAERFAIFESEQGLRKSIKVTATTLVVIAAAYMVMDSQFLQSMILAFPELLLLLVALNMWLGKWIGMRVSEFFRFRKLIWREVRE